AVNCEHPSDGDACGRCLACRKVAAGEHPDVMIYQRVKESQFIKIDEMRDMSLEAQYRPYEGKRRVLIVEDADRLNIRAANSILKTLEEPPATSLILLITTRPYALIETIRSRCQMLSFAPLAPAELETYLRAHFKRPDDEIKLLARLSRGSIGHAMEIDLGVYRDRRKIMMELVDAALVQRDPVRLINAAEYLGKKLDREQFIEHMNTLLGILSDIFYLKLDQPVERLTNVDAYSRLSQLADKLSIEQITDWVARIEELLNSMLRNINRQLATEAMLVSL
ncbi:MAG: ATP-binding protein, partial [Blastocatellia bacterium]